MRLTKRLLGDALLLTDVTFRAQPRIPRYLVVCAAAIGASGVLELEIINRIAISIMERERESFLVRECIRNSAYRYT